MDLGFKSLLAPYLYHLSSYPTSPHMLCCRVYLLFSNAVADSLESSESVDGSQAMEMTSLQTNSTLTTGERVAGSTDVFHLDLEDWKLLREGVLIPFENVIITGQLGEGYIVICIVIEIELHYTVLFY